MKRISPTEARANLTRWLDEAISGKSIGITHKGCVIKLQPVAVTEDWASEEYGLTPPLNWTRLPPTCLRAGKRCSPQGKPFAGANSKKAVVSGCAPRACLRNNRS